ncbi:hypothetical protein [Bacillus sp. UNC438CL73TsuS30]|uniref:hypothetical protein n=1 Tax=Bacillus sp. UNC438CL73TsuS30 TaxID=1340434 RepID=UPI000479D265|nr:hypothetical protein [Bacillus sp. UNC438CL73TsuS30]
MKNTKFLILLMFILPWLSLPLIGRKTVKRFLPSALFMCVYLMFEGMLAEKRKWWWFPYKIKPNVLGEMPLIFGPFLVGSLWVLKFTFGKFNLYLLVNIIVDAIFTYLGLDLFKKMGYVTLVRLSKLQLSLLFLVKSFFMYGFQVLYDKLFRKSLYYR